MNKISFGSNGVMTNLLINGKVVIYPYQFTEVGFQRGGIPVCFPFGINAKQADPNAPNHGFFKEYDFTKASNPSPVEFLKHVDQFVSGGEMFSINIKYTYELNDTALKISAEITNESDKRLSSNLGFHPFFNCPLPKEDVVINLKGHAEIVLSTETLEEDKKSKILPMPQGWEADIVIASSGKIKLKAGSEFTHCVIWRDSLSYICVEPIEAHIDDFNTEKGVWIEPGESKLFSLEMNFESE